MGKQAIAQELSYSQLRKLKRLEEEYAKKRKKSNPQLNFTVKGLIGYKWKPLFNSSFIKTDIINKNVR